MRACDVYDVFVVKMCVLMRVSVCLRLFKNEEIRVLRFIALRSHLLICAIFCKLLLNLTSRIILLVKIFSVDLF